MSANRDGQFANRADSHIRLSHQQVPLFGAGPTSDSTLFAAAWFAAYTFTRAQPSAEEIAARTPAEVDRLMALFRGMLEENFSDLAAKAQAAKESM